MTPKNPHQKGVAKRMKMTILEHACGYTLDCQSSSKEMQSTQQCIRLIEDHQWNCEIPKEAWTDK